MLQQSLAHGPPLVQLVDQSVALLVVRPRKVLVVQRQLSVVLEGCAKCIDGLEHLVVVRVVGLGCVTIR